MSTIQKDKTQEETLCITCIKWINKWMWLLWLNMFSYSNLSITVFLTSAGNISHSPHVSHTARQQQWLTLFSRPHTHTHIANTFAILCSYLPTQSYRGHLDMLLPSLSSETIISSHKFLLMLSRILWGYRRGPNRVVNSFRYCSRTFTMNRPWTTASGLNLLSARWHQPQPLFMYVGRQSLWTI